MRRILGLIVLFGVIAITVYTLFEFDRDTVERTDPWSYVPERAALVVEIGRPEEAWNRLSHGSQIWKTFGMDSTIAAVDSLLRRLFGTDDDRKSPVGSLIADRPLLICTQQIGGTRSGVLVIAGTRSPSKADIRSFMDQLGVHEQLTVGRKAGDIMICRPAGIKQDLFVAPVNDLLLLASHRELLEGLTSGVQPKRSILDDPQVKRVIGTFGAGADAHLLIHNERGMRVLDGFLAVEHQRSVSIPNGLVGLDLRIRHDAFMLSGVLLPDSSGEMQLNALGSHMFRMRPQELVPEDAVAFICTTINDPSKHLDALSVLDPTLQAQLDQWRDTLGVDAVNTVLNDLTSEVVAAFGPKEDDHWITARTSSSHEALQIIEKVAAGMTAKGVRVDSASYREGMFLDLTEPFPTAIFGTAYASMSARWLGQVGPAIVLASSKTQLQKIIGHLLDGRTLARDARAAQQFELMASDATAIMWADIASSTDRIIPLLMTADEEAPILRELGLLSVQLGQRSGGFVHLSAQLQFAPQQEAKKDLLWHAQLHSRVVGKPHLLRNHVARTLDVLVQLDDHRLVQYSSNGERAWERKLEGPIMGEVHQVDRYRNGKLQLLFNTANAIHLIDRNGKDVDGFPVKINELATAPVAVLDYDGKGDLRLLLPTADGAIANYNVAGERTKGWQAKKAKTPVVHPVEHVRIRSKDYLLAVQDDGTVNVLDRRGLPRYDPKLKLSAPSDAPLQMIPDIEIGKVRIAWTDTIGATHEGTLDGSTSGLFAATKISMQPLIGDLNGDGELDRVTCNKDSLMIEGVGPRPYRISLEGEVVAPPALYDFGQDRERIGVASSNDKVYLLNVMGDPVEGTPLEGGTAFSIGDINKDGLLELVVGTSDGRLLIHQLR